ncbi:phosphoadenylyl-sulfate reductase [Bacillus sp. 31A1R]|uniref:Adenosine 5'-phosphosulfate reductase n=1 Tax=Robertmurraya mangrovi TaxID=3098077 RepID=A0ABU5J3M0_9BACI|nr:phosphoadenylyl-sulfate reductase [Bacillus sp. 31A1R]MDZ5473957.1 phosphoadenylyl-sulfate reductase [Bacillus sp. 31A1R]
MKTLLTYETWDNNEALKINNELKDFMNVLKWAYQEYQDQIVYACSFGAEGMVLIDLISKINKNARIIFLDTDVHFKETYELIEKIKNKYPTLKIELIKPRLSLAEQAEQFGEKLWEVNPNLCCKLRKVDPLSLQLSGVHAWISGLRRDQSDTRRNVQYINKDDKFNIIKVCPLIHWTWDDVWSYIRINQLPYNELHDQNYPSIGCKTCTIPVEDELDSRAGRWASTNKKECGLHQA